VSVFEVVESLLVDFESEVDEDVLEDSPPPDFPFCE
jgi:hypothetical protein